MSYIYSPNLVQGAEPAENEITWKSEISPLGNILGHRWLTTSDLRHISNPACGDLRNRTQSLFFTDFKITDLPTEISGIELSLQTQRNGRIADDQIQLTYQGQEIGINNFSYITDADGNLPINNQMTYGSPTDLWGLDITAEMLQDSTFGVILKFQSHPYFPHSCGMLIDSVLLTIY
jgi:hypothetical protein